ncbi:folylpolyglutamate synthase/dihydrofolate synthase family protein [Clostridium sp. D33t1_170424_F3]|uniref:bifunctional folylpolyglutamate synthase/dihydrofolate synthase n=1 Tax=Clostridium sp. D33t1_170424_F3 TaxID=2787099 RepID=UPI0018ABF2C8|nr:folylpolyglutamate synthase/dihydrofolate synthase family protein [Clostridium sp. D33t1_170424_F3]
MTYEQAIETINSLLRFGMKPGLERMQKLLHLLGNPQDRLKFIHVAGTNGKGSTCSLITSVLEQAGYRTGLFTSPYVSDFCERIRIGTQMIPHDELAALVEETYPVVQEMDRHGDVITEFEFITALALQWYAKRECELVVLEVGLGGRLDATNVIGTPLVSVITSISLDHTAILGDTVEQIAAEKAGIIKPYGITVTYPEQAPDALKVIQWTAANQHNQFIEADSSVLTKISGDLHGTKLRYRDMELHLPLVGDHQIKNAVTALAALSVLIRRGYRIPDEAIKQGFASVRFPARLELLSEQPLVLLDGAHNPDGTRTLANAIRMYLGGRRIVALMGMLADKDVYTAAENLDGLFDLVVTLAPDNPRAMPADELAELWQVRGVEARAAHRVQEALQQAFASLQEDDVLVICGSLYLAGDVRAAALDILKKME